MNEVDDEKHRNSENESNEDEDNKERRNPSADAHEEPMGDGEALSIVPSWAWAIGYRPSLCHRPSLTYGSCARSWEHPRLSCLNFACRAA
jgi:hypothetical protein